MKACRLPSNTTDVQCHVVYMTYLLVEVSSGGGGERGGAKGNTSNANVHTCAHTYTHTCANQIKQTKWHIQTVQATDISFGGLRLARGMQKAELGRAHWHRGGDQPRCPFLIIQVSGTRGHKAIPAQTTGGCTNYGIMALV